MPARHKSRQRAVQVMFLWDARRQLVDESIAAFYRTLAADEETEDGNQVSPTPLPADSFMEQLVRGTSGATREIDQLIQDASTHWRLDRMPAVDRNIIRLAIYEMRSLGTPPAVVIDEALELSRQFAGPDSVKFVNGVLDAVREKLQTGHDAPASRAAQKASGAPAAQSEDPAVSE